MIQDFERLLDDSVKQEISIFSNPKTRAFIKKHRDELREDTAWDKIRECVEDNQQEYKKRIGIIPSQLIFDIEALHLAHGILTNVGEDEFERISWMK